MTVNSAGGRPWHPRLCPSAAKVRPAAPLPGVLRRGGPRGREPARPMPGRLAQPGAVEVGQEVQARADFTVRVVPQRNRGIPDQAGCNQAAWNDATGIDGEPESPQVLKRPAEIVGHLLLVPLGGQQQVPRQDGGGCIACPSQRRRSAAPANSPVDRSAMNATLAWRGRARTMPSPREVKSDSALPCRPAAGQSAQDPAQCAGAFPGIWLEEAMGRRERCCRGARRSYLTSASVVFLLSTVAIWSASSTASPVMRERNRAL